MTPVVIANYSDLVDALRARADELGATRQQIDASSGLPDGYSSKLLGPSKIRSMGVISLGPILGALGIKLIAVADDDALQRLLPNYGRRRHDALKQPQRTEEHVEPLSRD